MGICAFYVRFYMNHVPVVREEAIVVPQIFAGSDTSLSLATTQTNLSTSDALFAFMKNNLFALIKFVSINKYFRRKQASEAKTNNAFRMHFDSSLGE